MMKELQKYFNLLLREERTLLSYLKSKYPLFHKSNVFFRDIQFGIKYYLETREIKINYTESEILASEFIKHLENKGILKRISEQIFLLNYPEYVPSKIKSTKV